MSQLATTKLSSKGQIVIPENIRLEMGLNAGDQFIVVAKNDVVILKTITPPSVSEVKDLINKTRKAVKQAGITKAELKKTIKKLRKE